VARSVQALLDLLDTPTTAWAGTARLLPLGPNVPPLLLSSGRIQAGPHGEMSARMLALAKFGQRAIPAIQQRLDTTASDSSHEARLEAFALIRVLGSIGPPAVVVLVDVAASSPDPSRSGAALEQLVALEPQREAFGQEMSPWAFWRPADDRVAEIGQAIVPQLPRIAERLDRLLQTPRLESLSSKRHAAYLVARWGSGAVRQRGLDVLDQLARVPTYYEDLEAARFLQRLHAPSAAARLHEIVQKVPDNYELKDQVSLRIAIALYQFGDSSYVDILDRVFRTATPRTMVDAISFARTTGDFALVEPLSALLRDRTETDRQSITTVQGESVHTRQTIGDLALDALRSLTFQPLEPDPSAWNAWRASHPQIDRRQLLVEWVSSRTSPVTTVPMWEANAWIDAISTTADPASLALVAAYLSRPDLDASKIDGGQSRGAGGTGPIGQYGPAVVTLLLGLTQQGVADARELLAKCLSAADPRVRMYGALALAAYDRRSAIRQLTHELSSSSDEWIRNQAADFLLRLGDARGIPALIERLDSVHEATRHLACRDLRMYTQQPLPCDSHVSGDQAVVDLVYWRQWWRSHRHGFQVKAREAALDQRAALSVPAVIFSRVSVATDGTVAPRGAVDISSSIAVSLRLATGQIIMSKRAHAKPSRRGAFPGRELPYDGSAASAAISVRPTSRKSVVMLLNETAGPGLSVRLTAAEVGYPSDGTGIDRFLRAGVPDRVPEPCAAQSAFMLDGVGDRADAPVLVWSLEGRHEASFYVDPRENTLKIKPVLTLSTRRLRSAQPLEYSVVLDSRRGVTRGATEPDYLVIAVGKNPDGTYLTSVFPASQRQHGIGTLIQNPNESWEWRFYALEDGPQFHSHCRARQESNPEEVR
jgi:HEAT repeat protein